MELNIRNFLTVFYKEDTQFICHVCPKGTQMELNVRKFFKVTVFYKEDTQFICHVCPKGTQMELNVHNFLKLLYLLSNKP